MPSRLLFASLILAIAGSSPIVVAAQPVSPEECIFETVAIANRSSIGAAVLAQRLNGSDEMETLLQATNACARTYKWTVEQTLHANGYATMRFAADSIAAKLGHPGWSSIALNAIRRRPEDQVRNLAATGTGNAEFELVLAHMIRADPSIPGAIHASRNEEMESFVLMVKLLAVGELERYQLAS